MNQGALQPLSLYRAQWYTITQTWTINTEAGMHILNNACPIQRQSGKTSSIMLRVAWQC